MHEYVSIPPELERFLQEQAARNTRMVSILGAKLAPMLISGRFGGLDLPEDKKAEAEAIFREAQPHIDAILPLVNRMFALLGFNDIYELMHAVDDSEDA